jgi:ferredoxin-NADP reductase
MMMNASWSAATPPSILAFLTTVHLALVVLRAHRGAVAGAFSPITLVSVLFAASPWMMSSAVGLAIGFVVHGGWFVACERLLPGTVPASGSKPAPARAPAPPRAPVPAVAKRPVGIAQMARAPRQFVQTPVMAVFNETPDIRTFRMARPEGFEFKAGQFLTLRVRADGREHVRCYSISSPPGARGHLEITVKRLGLVSGALHATIRPGSMLSVRPPAGAFVYPAGEDRPLVLIAGGVGITPLMSMLRHAIDAEPMRPVTLVYSVRTVADLAFREELQLLNRRHTQFRAFFAISDGPADPGFFPGRITEALLQTTVPDIAHAICLLCGPPPMLAAIPPVLIGLGVPKGQIGHEVFQAAVAASGGAAAQSAEPRPPSPSETGSAHQVQFDRSGLTASVDATRTVLEAAESCGADIPSLCRAGVCGTCRTRVVSGEVTCASRMLDDQDQADGFVLPCVTHALGDCVVDA